MRRIWLLLWLGISFAIFGILYSSQAQTSPSEKKVIPAAPPNASFPRSGAGTVLTQERGNQGPAVLLSRSAEASATKPRDGTKMPENAQPIFFSAHRAMEWLKRTLKRDGRFVYGFQPALCVQLDGDNFASQAGAAFALARAARYFRDEAGTAKARLAILRLKLETMVDPGDKTESIRYTAAPPTAVNRLASHGLLLSAVHELDSAEKCADLLKMAEQLCNYLRPQQRPDGSLFVSVGSNLMKSGADDIDAEHAGWALQGIVRSQKHGPAPWKIELVRKARGFYHTQWQGSKNIATVCSHTPAYAQAYLITKDNAFAQTVFAMNDWLIGLQYRDDLDSARKHWSGGFQRFRDGKPELAAPDISSALPAESLAEACRVAKYAGDLARLQRYERALIQNVHFLMSLQYTSQTTKHFVDPFVPSILGAFHASHQDGNLRIDYTQHALCAMVQYLDGVIE
jgi:hypothetical protein